MEFGRPDNSYPSIECSQERVGSGYPFEITSAGWEKIERRASSVQGFSVGAWYESPLGLIGGRPIICDGAKIRSGVYLSPRPVEALVMDARCGHLWGTLQELFRERLPKAITQRATAEILAPVFFLVQETIPKNDQKVAHLLRSRNFLPDQKVSIELFIMERCGAARHQVLLAAFLIEKLCEGMLLSGEFFIRHRKPHLEEVLIFRAADKSEYTFAPGIY